MKTWSIIKDVINTKNKTPQVVNLSLMVILSLTVAMDPSQHCLFSQRGLKVLCMLDYAVL